MYFFALLFFQFFEHLTEDKTRHQEKWVKAVVGLVTKVWKGGLLLACFSAWPKVWVGGPESTKESALADDSGLGLAAMVCFLWLSDLLCDIDSWRNIRWWNAYHHLFMFSLSLHFYSSLCLPSFLNTWQKVTGKIGQLEAVKLNLEDSSGLCRRSKEDRARKTNICGKSNSMTWKKETSKLEDRITAALVICDEHMSNYHEKLKLMSSKIPWKAQTYVQQDLGEELSEINCQITLDEVHAPLQCFGVEID